MFVVCVDDDCCGDLIKGHTYLVEKIRYVDGVAGKCFKLKGVDGLYCECYFELADNYIKNMME